MKPFIFFILCLTSTHVLGSSILPHVGFLNDSYLSKAAKNDPPKFMVTLDMTCVREDDGGGNAEEVYGTINLVIVGSHPHTHRLWLAQESEAISLTEGSTHHLGTTTIEFNDEFIEGKPYTLTGASIEGALREDDSGFLFNKDDDLGTATKDLLVRSGTSLSLVSSGTLQFTHEKTIIEIRFEVELIW